MVDVAKNSLMKMMDIGWINPLKNTNIWWITHYRPYWDAPGWGSGGTPGTTGTTGTLQHRPFSTTHSAPPIQHHPFSTTHSFPFRVGSFCCCPPLPAPAVGRR